MQRFSMSFIAVILSVLLASCNAGCAAENTDSSQQNSAVSPTNSSDTIKETTSGVQEVSSDDSLVTSVVVVTEEALPTEDDQPTAPITEEAPIEAESTEESEQETVPEEAEEIKYVALTFDDGPNTTTTAEVLDVLEKYDIVASFFLVGSNIDNDSAKIVKRAYDMGCEINNHSNSHPYMNTMTADEVIAEYTATDDKILEITGERAKFFRPPYIAVSQDMLDNINVPFISGIGCNDWDDKVTFERRSAMILRQVKDGSIILLHDAKGNSKTVEALDVIISEMLSQGYRFVTVSQLFEVYGVEISAADEKIYSNVHQTSMY